MAQKSNPISLRLDLHRSSDSSRFSDSYYGLSVYQDVNLRSYFGSIRPPTRLTFGFRLGRCIIINFPKITFNNFFLPRRPRRLFRRKKTISWLKKKQCVGYHYHERSRSIKKNLLKEVRVSGAHPKYAGVVNDIAFLKNKTIAFRFSKFFKSRSNGPTSHILQRILPAVRFSLKFSVMQYFLNTKNQIHFDPVGVLNHFVARGVPSTMGGTFAQGISNDKRIRSRIAFFLESSKILKKGIKRLFIRQANDLRFAGTTKTTLSLFPFFGATYTFLFPYPPKYKKVIFLDAREQLLGQCWIKYFQFMGKDKVMKLIEKSRNLGGIIGEFLKKAIEMMIKIILRKRIIAYFCNSYFFEIKKIRSLLSNISHTNIFFFSVKIQSVYQSASLIAQDISFQLRNKKRSFRNIYTQIVKDISSVMKKGVEGIRICCSGRSKGKKIARTECGNYGKTSRNVFNLKIDYATAEVSTRYGILGVKVWISYI